MTTYSGTTYSGTTYNDSNTKSTEKVKSLLDTVIAKRNEFGRSTIDLTQNKIDWEHSDGDTVDILPSTVEVANGVTEPLKLRLHAGQGQSLDTYETYHEGQDLTSERAVSKMNKQREALATTRNEDSWFPWTKTNPNEITNQDIYAQGEKGKELLKAKLLGQNTLELGDLKQDPTLYDGKLSKRQIADVYDSSGSNIIDSLNTPENNVDYNSRFNSLGKLKNDLQQPTLLDNVLGSAKTALGAFGLGGSVIAGGMLKGASTMVRDAIIPDAIQTPLDNALGKFATNTIDTLPIDDNAKDTLKNLSPDFERTGNFLRDLYEDPATKASREAKELRASQTQREHEASGFKPEGIVDKGFNQMEQWGDAAVALVSNPRYLFNEAVPENLLPMVAILGSSANLAKSIVTNAAKTIPGGIENGVITEAGKLAGKEALSSEASKKALISHGANFEGIQSASSSAEQAQKQGKTLNEYGLPIVATALTTAAISKFTGTHFGDAIADIVSPQRTLGTGIKSVGKSAFTEGLIEENLQSMGEQAYLNLATGKPIEEGVGSAGGEGTVLGAAMGAGMTTPGAILDSSKSALQARKTPSVEPTLSEAVDVPKTEDLTPSKPSIDDYKTKVDTITDDNRQEVINQGIKDYPHDGTLSEKRDMASAINIARNGMESPEHDAILKQVDAESELYNWTQVPEYESIVNNPDTTIEDIQANLVGNTTDTVSPNTGSIFNDIGRTKDEGTLNTLKYLSTAKADKYAESNTVNDPYVLAKTGIETKHLPKASSEVFSAITRGESLDLNHDLLLLSSHVEDIKGTEEQKNTGISALTKTISKVYSDKVDITPATERTVKQALNTINGLVTNKGTITIEPKDSLEEIHRKILPTFGSQPIVINNNKNLDDETKQQIQTQTEFFKQATEHEKKYPNKRNDKTTSEVGNEIAVGGKGTRAEKLSITDHLKIITNVLNNGGSIKAVNTAKNRYTKWVSYHIEKARLAQKLAKAKPSEIKGIEQELSQHQPIEGFSFDYIPLVHTTGKSHSQGIQGLANEISSEANIMKTALDNIQKQIDIHFGITPQVTSTPESTSQTDENVLNSTNVNQDDDHVPSKDRPYNPNEGEVDLSTVPEDIPFNDNIPDDIESPTSNETTNTEEVITSEEETPVTASTEPTEVSLDEEGMLKSSETKIDTQILKYPGLLTKLEDLQQKLKEYTSSPKRKTMNSKLYNHGFDVQQEAIQKLLNKISESENSIKKLATILNEFKGNLPSKYQEFFTNNFPELVKELSFKDTTYKVDLEEAAVATPKEEVKTKVNLTDVAKPPKDAETYFQFVTEEYFPFTEVKQLGWIKGLLKQLVNKGFSSKEAFNVLQDIAINYEEDFDVDSKYGLIPNIINSLRPYYLMQSFGNLGLQDNTEYASVENGTPLLDKNGKQVLRNGKQVYKGALKEGELTVQRRFSDYLTVAKGNIFNKVPNVLDRLFSKPEKYFTNTDEVPKLKEFVKQFKGILLDKINFEKTNDITADPLVLLHQDKKLNDNVVSAFALSLLSFINSSTGSAFNANQMINSIFGRDADERVDAVMQGMFSTVGVGMTYQANSVGAQAVALLGIKSKNILTQRKLEASVGLQILNAGIEAGYLERHFVQQKDMAVYFPSLNEDTVNELTDSIITQDNIDSKLNGGTYFVRIATQEYEDEKYPQVAEDIIALLDETKKISKELDEILGTEFNKQKPNTKPYSKEVFFKRLGDTWKATATKYTLTEKEALFRYSNIAYSTNTKVAKHELSQIENFVRAIGTGKPLTWKSIEVNSKGAEGKDRQISNDIQEVKDGEESAKKTGSIYFFNWLAKQGREHMTGGPQSNKWMRWYFVPEGMTRIVDKSSDNPLHQYFKIAVLAAFGTKIDALLPDAVNTKFDALQSELKPIQEAFKDPVKNQQKILEAIWKYGEGYHTYAGMLEMMDYMNTPKDGSFQTSLMREDDGISNGPFIGYLLFSGGKIGDEASERVLNGFAASTDSQFTYAQHRANGGLDNYELIRDKIEDAIRIFSGANSNYTNLPDNLKNAIQARYALYKEATNPEVKETHRRVLQGLVTTDNQGNGRDVLGELGVSFYELGLVLDVIQNNTERVPEEGKAKATYIKPTEAKMKAVIDSITNIIDEVKRNFAKGPTTKNIFGSGAGKNAKSIGDNALANIYNDIESVYNEKVVEHRGVKEDQITTLKRLQKDILNLTGYDIKELDVFGESEEALIVFKLPTQVEAKIIKQVQQFFIPVLRSAIQEDWKQFNDNRAVVNEVMNISNTFVKTIVEKRINNKILENSKADKTLLFTNEDLDKIYKDLEDQFPALEIPNFDGTTQKVSFWKFESTNKNDDRFTVQTNIKGGKSDVEVHYQSNGVVTSVPYNISSKSLTGHAVGLIIADIGVRVPIMSIHYSDSIPIKLIMQSAYKSLLVHDGVHGAIDEVDQLSYIANKGIYEHINKFNPFESVMDYFNKVIAMYEGDVNKNLDDLTYKDKDGKQVTGENQVELALSKIPSIGNIINNKTIYKKAKQVKGQPKEADLPTTPETIRRSLLVYQRRLSTWVRRQSIERAEWLDSINTIGNYGGNATFKPAIAKFIKSSPKEFEAIVKKEFEEYFSDDVKGLSLFKEIFTRVNDLYNGTIIQTQKEFIESIKNKVFKELTEEQFKQHQINIENKILGTSKQETKTKPSESNTNTSSKSYNEIYNKLGNKTVRGNVVIHKVYQRAGIDLAKKLGGVFSLRVKNSNKHFGNPFSSEQDLLKDDPLLMPTKSTQDSVEKYIDWLTTNDFDNIITKEVLERKKWILEQLPNLKGKPIIYYKELGEPSHATALDYLINEYVWGSKPSKSNKEVVTSNESFTSLNELTNHSGGAKGADSFWEEIGKLFGVLDHKHYFKDKTPKGNTQISEEDFQEGLIKAKAAAKALGKAWSSNDYIQGLLARNWLQVKNSDAIFAIGTITGKFVNGGTGYAIEMAKAEGKPIYVFDYRRGKWYEFTANKWKQIPTPTLTKNFAGIGSRDIEKYNVQDKTTKKWETNPKYVGKQQEEAARQAIKDVYQKTKDSLKEKVTTSTTQTNEDNKPLGSTQSNPLISKEQILNDLMDFIAGIDNENQNKNKEINTFIDKLYASITDDEELIPGFTDASLHNLKDEYDTLIKKIISKPKTKDKSNTLTVEDLTWLNDDINASRVSTLFDVNRVADATDFTLKKPLVYGATTITYIEVDPRKSSIEIRFNHSKGQYQFKYVTRNGKLYPSVAKLNSEGLYTNPIQNRIDETSFEKKLLANSEIATLLSKLKEDLKIDIPENKDLRLEAKLQSIAIDNLQSKYGINRNLKDVIELTKQHIKDNNLEFATYFDEEFKNDTDSDLISKSNNTTDNKKIYHELIHRGFFYDNFGKIFVKQRKDNNLGSTPNAEDLFNDVITDKETLTISGENIVSESDSLPQDTDPVHREFLRNFVSQVIAPVVEATELLLFSKATYTYGQYSAELKKVAINIGKAMKDDLDIFQMSAQEVFAHEFVHVAQWAAYGLYDNKHIRNIVDTLFYKLEHEFNKYKARHPEDRTLDKWDGYVFNNKDFIDVTVHNTTTGKPLVVSYNRGIQEFLAFGSTNKEFRELLTKLKPRQLKVTEVSASTVSDEVREATWIEVISNVLKKVLDSFIRLAKGKNSLEPLIVFDKNVRNILAANGKTGYLNTTVPIVDRGDTFISEKAKDAGLGVLKFVAKGRGSKIQIIDSLGKYADSVPYLNTFENTEWIRETIKLIRHEPTRNLLLDTWNDIKGTTETNKPLENAILNQGTIEGERNTATAKDVQEYQKKIGVLNDLQDTALKNVVLSGELFSVRDNYPTKFINLLEDSKALNQEIKALEDKIPKLVSDTKNLASMMVLGKYTETGLGKHNAALVAKQGRNIPQDKYQKELDLVTKLSRLYAIGLQDVNHVNEVIKLLKDKPQAMNEVMNVHRENVKKAHAEGHALTIHDGEIPTSNNPFRSIHLGTKEDEKFLVENWGATIIGNLERDPNDSLTTPGVLYLITEKTQQDYDSKAMAFVSRNSESSNFHSGFVMTDRFKAAENREKAKLKDDGTKSTNNIKQKNNSNVSRVAIFNQQGKVIRYEYVLDKATKDKYLKPTINAFKDLATQKNAITYINEATKLNNQLVDKLYNYWKELGHKARKDMIWIGSEGKYKDLWNMIPTETKAYFETKFGTTKGFYMAEEELRTVFGYRKQTITNWIQPVLEDELHRNIGNHIYYMAKRLGFNLATITAMESMWIEGISFAKDTIVVKSGVVSAANESSNFMTAKLEGMPIPFYYQSKIRAMKAEQQFRRDSDALLAHLSNAYGNPEYVTEAIEHEMNKLKSAISNNPMSFLHEEGLASTIAEENAHKDKHETKLYSKTERARNLFDKLPKVVKDTLRVATISEGTKIYTLMNEIAQMGDITSRFALIEWEAEKAKRSGTKFDYESAIDKAKFLFIQYHSVTNDKVQWGNDIGLIMFSKFGTKAIGVLAHMFGNHIGRLLALGILEDVLGASDWIWNTSMNKFAIPTSSLYAAIDASPIANALITPPAYMPKELFSKLGILPVVSGL